MDAEIYLGGLDFWLAGRTVAVRKDPDHGDAAGQQTVARGYAGAKGNDFWHTIEIRNGKMGRALRAPEPTTLRC